ncbi:AAA family ATPase [Arthrobacter sp. R4-81]
MLLKLQVANFRSLRDPATLNLYRTGKRPKDVAAEDWSEVSPIMAVFGSNASGKSTLYEALRTVQTAVRNSYTRWEPDSAIPIMPFLLDPEFITQPTEFSIEFKADDDLEYVYGFSCDQSRILTEHLYVYKSAHRTVLFERGLGDDLDDIRFGPSFKGMKAELKQAVQSRPNALTLSAGSQLGASSQLTPAYHWITQKLHCYDSQQWEFEHLRVQNRLLHDPSFQESLLTILSKADLGIDGIEVKETEVPQTPDGGGLVGRLNYTFSKNGALRAERSSGQLTSPIRRELILSHKSPTGSTPFPMAYESQGTKSFIALVSKCLQALETGGTVIVDEIDSSLHSVLTAEIVSMFKSQTINKRQAQLIFTTHDVALLSKGTLEHPLLERDQIYLVEKDKKNASYLISLTEYKIRPDENIFRNYIMGRYGGLPSPSFLESALLTDLPLNMAN